MAIGGITAAAALPSWAQTKAKPRTLALIGDVELQKPSIRWLLRDL
jgi:hypothetical protein